jgi:tetratricopeptide (TPR) repeat protein
MTDKYQTPRPKFQEKRYIVWFLVLVSWVFLVCSCAYFNTFYNAQYYFREARKKVTNDTLKVDVEEFSKTIEKTTSIIVKYPRSRYVDNALYMMGVSYYYKGDYPRALEKLDYLLYNYTESNYYDDALYYRGLSYFKQQKYGKAAIDLKEAGEFKKYRHKAMLILCYSYYAIKDYAELTRVAGRMIDEHLSKEERRWILHILGDAQFEQEQYPEALETYDWLLALTGTVDGKRTLKLKIAETYLEMGEYEKCRDFLEGEYDPEFRNIFADLNAELGDTAKAKEVYLEVAVSGFAEVAAQAFYKLADLYRAEDSLDMAIAFFDSSVSRSISSEYGIRAKKMAGVLRRIKMLSEQTDDLDEAQFLLAETYYVDFGDPQRASDEYDVVYTMYPASTWAPKALYARFWINHTVIKNDSIARQCATLLTRDYAESEYSISVEKTLGWDKPEEEEAGTKEPSEEESEPDTP